MAALSAGRRAGVNLGGPLVLVGMLKAAVLIGFFYTLYSRYGLEMVPAMRDQLLYLTDIRTVARDFYFLFADDQSYRANNTLYSRAAGALAWLSGSGDAPLISAVVLNTLMHLGTAYYAAKTLLLLGGRRYQRAFLVIALSPTIWAYSLFALRDLMICFFFTYFIYAMLSRGYLSALLALLALYFLRPLFLAYAVCAGVAFAVVRQAARYRNWPMYVFVGFLALTAASYFILEWLGFFWVFNLFTRPDFSVGGFFLSLLGYGVFVGDLSANMAGAAGLRARFLMIDSLILPIVYLLAVVVILRKNYSSAVKVFAVNSVMLLVALNFSYLAIQDNFPFRKLLPVFPMLYVVVLLALERRAARRGAAGRRWSETTSAGAG